MAWLHEDIAFLVACFLEDNDVLIGWSATCRTCATRRILHRRQWCARQLKGTMNRFTLGYGTDDDLGHRFPRDLREWGGASFYTENMAYISCELIMTARGWEHVVYDDKYYRRVTSVCVPRAVKSSRLDTAPVILNGPGTRVSVVYGYALSALRIRNTIRGSLVLRALVG